MIPAPAPIPVTIRIVGKAFRPIGAGGSKRDRLMTYERDKDYGEATKRLDICDPRAFL
jgi:hypothetical protein